ncbi:cox cluster protein [Halobacteriales archaeon SW_8_65_20]|nr:MAG: cox cluster protein [Halobacteriales archaeon SW_8_65_20]
MSQRESETGETAGTGKLSSWPLFVALGLAVGEVGVVMAVYPLAIGGLVLFAGSVAGILTESGYAERPWRALTALSGLFVLLGLVVVWTQTGGDLTTVQQALASTDTVVLRGFSITGAGVVSFAAGLAGSSITETGRAA